MNFQAPIPGQSLTREPGNSPWEQPPLYHDNDKAIAWHLDRLSKPEHADDLLFLLERGLPIQTFVDSLMTKAVMEGYHTIDTSTLISPVIHSYVKKLADASKTKYIEWSGPTQEEKDEQKFKQRLSMMIADPNVRAEKKGGKTEIDINQPPTSASDANESTGLIPRRK